MRESSLRRVFCVLVLSVFCLSAGCVSSSPAAYNYRAAALQGDLSDAEKRLAASGTLRDRERLVKFSARFVTKEDGLELDDIDDLAIREIAAAYQAYWRAALLAPVRRSDLEADHLKKLQNIIDSYDRAATNVELNNWIEGRGFQALTGRTPPLLEFMLWRRSRKVEEKVEITDGVQTVPVTYLEGFLVDGWVSFASLGESRSSGWANQNGLFVMADAYEDLNGEAFQVSYLKHEARHFADIVKYPAISAADREYRAKLTELVYADKTLRRVLEKFVGEGARVDVPHPLASWHVMHNLSKELFGDDISETWWKEADHQQIRETARRLIKEHDKLLTAAGAAETKGVIRP